MRLMMLNDTEEMFDDVQTYLKRKGKFCDFQGSNLS